MSAREADERKIGEISESLDLREITALMRFASENGIDEVPDCGEKRQIITPKPVCLPCQSSLLAAMERLVTQHHESPRRHDEKISSELICLYARLCQRTNPVNGRTLLDTACMQRILWWHLAFTMVLFLLAVLVVLVNYWIAGTVTPEEGMAWNWRSVNRYILAPISPFVWGALGACVYLLKRLSDIAERRRFDRQQFRGWWLRIFLGGILGYVVVELFDLRVLGGGEMPLQANAVAFLVGLSVKVVYGALEKLVEVLSEKLNLGALRRGEAPDDFYAVLGRQLAEAQKAGETERARAYVRVLEDLGRRPPGG